MTELRAAAPAGAFDSPAAEAWGPLLARAITGEGVATAFQPIVDLQRLAVVGYEALARFAGPPGLSPDRWFAAAAARGLGADLEAAVLHVALARRAALPDNCFLAVNVEPESLLAPNVLDAFAACGDLGGLVIEVTEHRPVHDWERTRQALQRLQHKGAIVAVDDAGAGYAGLQHILALRPAILKLDRALIEGVDRDEAKAALVEMLGLFASRIDAWLLAEGVETEKEARRLMDLGVPLAQGYFFGRPSPPWAALDHARCAPLEAHRETARKDTLHALVEASPWVTADQTVEASRRVSNADEPFYVVLDDDRRPVGVLDRRAASEGIKGPLVANVHSSPRDVAHRLATRRVADTSTPVVVTDNAGRYLGAVTITRLFVALASA